MQRCHSLHCLHRRVSNGPVGHHANSVEGQAGAWRLALDHLAGKLVISLFVEAAVGPIALGRLAVAGGAYLLLQ